MKKYFYILIATMVFNCFITAEAFAVNTLLAMNIESSGENSLLRLQGSEMPNFNSFTLKNPRRLVIDIAGSNINIPDREQLLKDKSVTKVKLDDYNSTKGKVARLTLFLVKNAEYEINVENKDLVVTLFPPMENFGATTVAKTETEEAPPKSEHENTAGVIDESDDVVAEAPPAPPTELPEPPVEEEIVETEEVPAEPPRPKEPPENSGAMLAQAEAPPAPEPQLDEAPPPSEPVAEPDPVETAEEPVEENIPENQETPPPVEGTLLAQAEHPPPPPPPPPPVEEEVTEEEAAPPPPPPPPPPVEEEDTQPPPPPPPVEEEDTPPPSPPPPPAPKGMVEEVEEIAEQEPQQSAPPPLTNELTTEDVVVEDDFQGTRDLRMMGLKMMGDRTRVYFKLDHPTEYNVVETGEDTLTVTLMKSKISKRNNRRTIDARWFATAVSYIKPNVAYNSVKVDIALKQKVPFSTGQLNNMVFVDFALPSNPDAVIPGFNPGKGVTDSGSGGE